MISDPTNSNFYLEYQLPATQVKHVSMSNWIRSVLYYPAIFTSLLLLLFVSRNPRYSDDHEVASMEHYDFIIITKSSPASLQARTLLRKKGWLSHDWPHEISWRHFFLVGLDLDPLWSRSSMEAENGVFGDIIVTDTFDTYRRLTYKLMHGLQQTLDKYDFKFVVVLSEDTIVNVLQLDQFLRQLQMEGRDKLFYGGARCVQRVVSRDKKSLTTREVWGPEYFPYYCIGTGLIFSRDTVERLLHVWDENRQPINGLDDCEIGSLLFYSGGDIKITWITNITDGCKKGRTDSFIVTQIKPLQKGVELMDNWFRDGVYCAEDVPPHDH